MLQIVEVNIYSIDKGEDSWGIEGEVLFEDDITAPFDTIYLLEDEEFEDLSLELDLDDDFSMRALKSAILAAANAFEE